MRAAWTGARTMDRVTAGPARLTTSKAFPECVRRALAKG